ncbi:outer membrane lipoprotein carrier protein LolA [Deinococcus sp.]|uniref:outer membrane lipoprotein carrier protein LolA n=1 Tax=Deinococcus sp. TaxID=47478 RepID=UPI003B5B9FC1
MTTRSLTFLSLSVLLALSGVSIAQTQTADAILAKVAATQKSAKDISFKVSGKATLDAGDQAIDLDIQSIPAANLARVVFNAPDVLADNIVVVDDKEVRNYLYLTNQVTVTSVNKAAGQDLSGLDLSQLSNLVSALKTRYDVKVLGSSGSAGSRLYQLAASPKNGVQGGESRVWISENGWRPTRFQSLDSAGKVVADLNVSDYKVNTGLTAARLKQLPKDAEVVRQ